MQSRVWVRYGGIVLSKTDKNTIGSGKLNVLMVNMAQMLLRIQFPKLGGLQLTLLQIKQGCAPLKG